MISFDAPSIFQIVIVLIFWLQMAHKRISVGVIQANPIVGDIQGNLNVPFLQLRI